MNAPSSKQVTTFENASTALVMLVLM